MKANKKRFWKTFVLQFGEHFSIIVICFDICNETSADINQLDHKHMRQKPNQWKWLLSIS